MKKKIIKYQLDGTKVEVIRTDGPQCLVAPFYKYDGEEFIEDVNFHWTFRRNLFSKPDQAKKIVNQEIAKLQSQVEALKIQKKEIGSEIIKTSQIVERLGNKNKVLEQLEDFINGKIKWVLMTGRWTPQLESVEKLKNDNNDGEFRLLSLYGKSNGDIGWRVSEYYDGSGSRTNCLLFTDYEKARETLKELLLKNEKIGPYDIEEAQKHGIELPADKIEEWKKDQRDRQERDIKDLEEKLTKMKKEYQKI